MRTLILGFVTMVVLTGVTANAQTASIAGTILDPSNAGVPGATITATNQATAAVRKTTTDNSGTYSIPNLPVGSYDVSVGKAGFSTLSFRTVQLTVAQNLTLNGTLEVGAVTQSVEVAGTSVAPINLEDAQLSNVVDQKRIEDLPLITRDPYSLVLLSPGTLQNQNGGLGGISVNGQRERNNNFLLDGVDNNDAGVPGYGGTGVSSINPDSTQEFRVITNNFLPEFGRNTGAIIDIVTRGGTNQFHGDAYEFNRVNALAARDFFNPSPVAGQPPDPQNPFVRNQFGASFGGPIKKDKTFFFVNAEWDRFRTTLTNEAVVPTAAFKSGIFDYNGQQINLASPSSPNNPLGLPLDPTMQKVFALYPNPNGPAVDSIRGIYFFPASSPQNNANVTFKVDQHISDKYTVSARFIYNGGEDIAGTPDLIPGIGGVSQTSQQYNGSLSFIAAFTPNLVNEFRSGLNKSSVPFTCDGSNIVDKITGLDPVGAGTDYSFAQSNGVGTITDFGCGDYLASNSQYRRYGTWTVADNLSWVRGRHTIKVGGEFRYVFENGYTAFFSRPDVDFTAFGNLGINIVNCPVACNNASDEVLQTMAAALLGVPGLQSQTQYFNKSGDRTPTDFRQYVQHEYGTFVQDSWKVRNNLTLQLGLRWEFDGVPFERGGNLSNLLDQQPYDSAPITFQTVGPGTGRQLYRDDYKDFEPRLGLAWDPFNTGKTSFRVGYGIFHDRIFGNLFGNAAANPPFEIGLQLAPNGAFAGGTGSLVTLANLLPPATLPPPSATVQDGSFLSAVILDPNMKTPYSQAWNVGIQRDLGHGMTLEVNYVGSGTHRLARSVDGNPPQPALIAAAQAAGTFPTFAQCNSGTPCPSGQALRLGPLVGLPQLTGNLALFEPAVDKSIGNATYEGLQTTFRKRLGYGLDLQIAYTWSHAIDDANDPLVAPGGDRNIARNSFNLHEDRGNSDFDLRHRAIINFLYELPVGVGHKYFNQGAGAKLFGGWELAGLSTLQSGHPYDVYSDRDSELTGLSNRPDVIAFPSVPDGAARNQVGPLVTDFAVQPYGVPGDFGRNRLTGPNYFDTDLSLIKNTHVTERINVQFRAEVYNVFNRIQFTNPDASGDTLSNPGTFGQSLATITQPDGTTSARQIQLALKLIF
jgi:Carboxypeptidase regulatory-like domain/TonB dependent receptor/TonB-dependent Receptor Plug Domain